MTDFAVVPADAGMIGQLWEIERAVFSDPWRAGDLAGGLNNPLLCTLAASDTQGRIPGYVTGSLLPPEGEIWRLAVLPGFRRSGIGRALVEAFLENGGRRGCDRFFLEVRAGNLPAIGLYAACGFVPCGRRRNYYRDPAEDAVLMRKGVGEKS